MRKITAQHISQSLLPYSMVRKGELNIHFTGLLLLVQRAQADPVAVVNARPCSIPQARQVHRSHRKKPSQAQRAGTSTPQPFAHTICATPSAPLLAVAWACQAGESPVTHTHTSWCHQHPGRTCQLIIHQQKKKKVSTFPCYQDEARLHLKKKTTKKKHRLRASQV